MQDEIAAVVQEMRHMAIVAGQASIEGPVTAESELSARFAERCSAWADRLSAASSSPGEPTMTVRVIRDGKAEDVTFQRTLPDPPCPLCGSSSSPGETRETVNTELLEALKCLVSLYVDPCPYDANTTLAAARAAISKAEASPHGPSSGEGWQPGMFCGTPDSCRTDGCPAEGRCNQPVPQPHYWTPDETKNRCIVCGDGPWGRHRFQVQPDTPLPAPPQESSREET
jgi:hypothetical protein